MRSLLLLAVAGAALFAAAPLRAAVVVLANRTPTKVAFNLAVPGTAGRQFELAADDVVPYPVSGDVQITFQSADSPHRYLLPADSIASFDTRQGKLDLFLMPLPKPAKVPAAEIPEPLPADKEARRHAVGTIPVMLLVDDDEPAVRQLWEKRLRKRLAEASDIFERTCRMRFEVVAVGTWHSDNKIHKFMDSFHEFEMNVIPAPAQLAIGFTSQYEVIRGKMHLGGTRGPLYSHILIREWSQHVTEAQRLEVLVHELGHYLGAVHLNDPKSVMRPVLTDRRSNSRDFRIGFDPVNTLILYLVSEEIRTRGVKRFIDLSEPTKARLRVLYTVMQKALPGDDSAAGYLALLDHPLSDLARPADVSKQLGDGTRTVLEAIAAAAAEKDRPTDGDRLTELYVRRAARAAEKLPKEIAARAFLLGLGLGLDRSSALRKVPVFTALCRQAETDDELAHRLKLLGTPTMHGRMDLAQHFAVSAGLMALVGPKAAEAAGLFKEVIDSRHGSGFSFVDFSADLSGVALAQGVVDGRITLGSLAESFRIDACLPAQGDLRDGIPWTTFVENYGSTSDDRFRREVDTIRQRIKALPVHKKGGQGPGARD